MPSKATKAPAPTTRTTRSKVVPAAKPDALPQVSSKRPLDDESAGEEEKKPPAKKPRGRPKKTKSDETKDEAMIDAVEVVAEKKPRARKARGKAKKAAEDEKEKAEDSKAADDQEVVKEPAAKKTKGRGKKAEKEKEVEEVKDPEPPVVEDENKAAPSNPAAKGTGKGKGKAKTVEADAEDAGDEEHVNGGPVKDDEKASEEKPANMVTVLKRGAAPVDPNSNFTSTHQVYVDPQGEVYDALLNQTNIGANANKFYNLQLLHPIGVPTSVALHTRWGRVGERGSSQDKGPFAPQMAIAEFKKQFRSKAGVAWEQRKGMEAKPGKYTFIERDFEAEEEKEDSPGPSDKKAPKAEPKIPESTLQPELKALMKLIFNAGILDATLSSFSYDQNKAPLGKMSKSTLLKGFAELKVLSEMISNPTSDQVLAMGGLRHACSTVSGRYYSYIPHVFGRNPPIVIDNEAALKRELDLVDALGDMEIASKLLSKPTSVDTAGNPINPIDSQLASLDLKSIQVLQKGSKEFMGVAKYARETHGVTHQFGAEVVDVFRVERKGEKEAWDAAGWDQLPTGDRLLLWHGSRTSNFAGILKQGLRIAPPEAYVVPVNGYMFGKGVYFADMMSKSAGYCHSYLSDQTGLLLLCEVAAKPFYETVNADYNAADRCRSADALSTKGLGRTAPTKWVDAGKHLGFEGLTGTMMPNGPGEAIPLQQASLMYNEYIVYSPDQIKLRYLLKCKLQ